MASRHDPAFLLTFIHPKQYYLSMDPKKKVEIICRCNSVNRVTIEQAIRDGARTLNEIFDATGAGVGPCGGSCRRKLGPLLDYFLKNGSFPETIKEDMTGKIPKKD